MYTPKNKKVKSIFQINTILFVCALFLARTSWAIDSQCAQTHLSPAISLNNSSLTNTYLLYQQRLRESVSSQYESTFNISGRSRKIRKRDITEGIITGIKRSSGYPLGFMVEIDGNIGFAHRSNIYPFDFGNLTEAELEQLIGKRFGIRIIDPGIPGEKNAFVTIQSKDIKQIMLKRNSTHKGKIIKIIKVEDKLIGIIVIVKGIKCFAYADKIEISTNSIRLESRLDTMVDVTILKPAIEGKDPKVRIFDRDDRILIEKHIVGTAAHKEFQDNRKPQLSRFGEKLEIATKTLNFSQPMNLIHQAI